MGQGVILCFIIFIFSGVEASLLSLNAYINSIYIQTLGIESLYKIISRKWGRIKTEIFSLLSCFILSA